MKKSIVIFALLALFGFCGCLSYDYEGDKAPSVTDSENIRVYTDKSHAPAGYRVLGKAQVSGSYQDVSRERMISKLKTEAADCGADAIIITEQQVLPEEGSTERLFQNSSDTDSSSGSWGQIANDVDVAYGSAFDRSKQTTTNISNYRRIIRAEYIQTK